MNDWFTLSGARAAFMGGTIRDLLYIYVPHFRPKKVQILQFLKTKNEKNLIKEAVSG